ncbi:MAG: 2-dehydropantoate 2-reductase [Alcanivoracaceae bacterium]|nr:2-dehydropantoate 2-reductase [Alcanivoracaceae bacterium]
MSKPSAVDVWHLVGAGSMGSLAAARLLAAGFSLRLISRDHQPAQRQLHWPDGRTSSIHLAADDNDTIRHLVVAVKAGETIAAIQPLLSRMHPQADIVRLQNGMGSLDGLTLPGTVRCLHLVSTDGAWRDAEQIQVVAENRTLIGDGSPRPPPWLTDLQPHWPGLSWTADIERAQWQKLAVNAVINPLTALYRCRNGELLDAGEREQRMQLLAQEADALLARLYPDWPADTLARSCEVARQTAANTSSMLADVLAGRPTEVQFINGYLLRRAGQLGLALPAHQALLTELG